uniref:Uncharacterized protein n=1 Tax=Sphaerodactylus townsendi TaxID=933632 RepID=A0ACB8FNR6_9SAUR
MPAENQVQLAEMEGLSLNSDKSSILLGDDEDNHSVDQLSPKETQDGLDSTNSLGMEDLEECLLSLADPEASPAPESYLCEMEETAFSPVQSWLKNEGNQVPMYSPSLQIQAILLLPVPA